MKRGSLAVGAMLALVAGTGLLAASPDPVSRKFLGAWMLVSTEQVLADGTRRPNPLFGANASGYLMYTETRMCAVLVNPNRLRWEPGSTPTDQEVRAAFNGLTSYCGAWEVDAKQGLVIHHVELDKTPNLMGTLRKRYFSFSGDHLVLRPAPPLPDGVKEYSLTWERVKK